MSDMLHMRCHFVDEFVCCEADVLESCCFYLCFILVDLINVLNSHVDIFFWMGVIMFRVSSHSSKLAKRTVLPETHFCSCISVYSDLINSHGSLNVQWSHQFCSCISQCTGISSPKQKWMEVDASVIPSYNHCHHHCDRHHRHHHHHHKWCFQHCLHQCG